jgi:hypothetical protein
MYIHSKIFRYQKTWSIFESLEVFFSGRKNIRFNGGRGGERFAYERKEKDKILP